MATKVFIIFGRFQPPTIGHERLFNTALQRANVDSADVAVFVSQTEDNKNPIPYAEKVKVIRKSVPRIIIGPKTVRTPAEALTWAFERGYQDIRLLVGDDRLSGFEKMAGSWQKAEDPKKRAVVRVEALPRTGSMAASKVSGTVARRYAQVGDVKRLKNILISGAQDDTTVKHFITLIQRRLGKLKEMVMPKNSLREDNDAQVNRVMERLLADSSWLSDDTTSPELDTELPTIVPDNHGVFDPDGRVPEDTEDNKSILVLYPGRRVKYDMINKVKERWGEELPTHIQLPRMRAK